MGRLKCFQIPCPLVCYRNTVTGFYIYTLQGLGSIPRGMSGSDLGQIFPNIWTAPFSSRNEQTCSPQLTDSVYYMHSFLHVLTKPDSEMPRYKQIARYPGPLSIELTPGWKKPESVNHSFLSQNQGAGCVRIIENAESK